MNRLQKKCFIVSAGLHLLLAVILVVGPAFLSSKDKTADMRILDFVPSRLVDAAVSGGGNPNAKPPPRAIPAPQPAPQPQKMREPEPPREPVKPNKVAPESWEATKEQKPKKPQLTLTPAVRKKDSPKTMKEPPATDPRERQLADARRRTAELISRTTRSLRDDLSSTTTIDTNYGPGGGGEAYANYAQVVKSIYEHAWVPPDDSANDDAITKVTVTIANDGTVISARVLQASGDSKVDNSVQRTLDRVTFIAPFPEGAKEKQRTYTINFNLKAKRLLG
jgi:protein TonB